MARRRWYRRYPRVVAAKKRWASNFDQSEITNNVSAHVLVENESSSAPTPIIIKTGNFKVQGDALVTNGGGHFRGRIFIMYVPEGWNNAAYSAIPSQHPEWIIGWTILDVSQANGEVNKFSITSRLKRNLNSGDRIVLYAETADTGASYTWEINFCAQWFTCSN